MHGIPVFPPSFSICFILDQDISKLQILVGLFLGTVSFHNKTYAKQEPNQQFLHTMHKQGNISAQIKNKTVND